MAKPRRRRGRPSPGSDVAARPVKPPTDPALASLRLSAILPLVADLQSDDAKLHTAAAEKAIANLIPQEASRKLLLRERVVHLLLATVAKPLAPLECRAAGWRILEALAREEGLDFCLHLFRLNILAPIQQTSHSLVNHLSSTHAALPAGPQPDEAATTSIASSLVKLIKELAEAGQEISNAISQKSDITRMLGFFVTGRGLADEARTRLRTDALLSLLLLIEDNPELAQSMVDLEDGHFLKATISLAVDETGRDAILACGLLHNLFSLLHSASGPVLVPGADDSILIPTLSKCIESISLKNLSPNGNGRSDLFEQHQLALETLGSMGTSLGTALTMAASNPHHDEWEGLSEDEMMSDVDTPLLDADAHDEQSHALQDDGEMDTDEMEADMEMVTAGDNLADDSSTLSDLPVLRALVEYALPPLIAVAGLEPAGDGDEEKTTLRRYALSALNNIAWSVSLLDFSDGQNSGIEKVWAPIGRRLWEQAVSPVLSADTTDLGLATQVTGLAWALARTLGGQVPLQADEQLRFISLYRATQGLAPEDAQDPLNSLGVRCIGVLGQLALHPAPVERNSSIGGFFLDLLASPRGAAPAADIIETLNQLFDVYGDEDYPYDGPVFWANNYMARLEEALPKVRALVKSIERKSKAELRTRGEESVLNLGRFLAYKRKHKPVP